MKKMGCVIKNTILFIIVNVFLRGLFKIMYKLFESTF